MNPYINWVNFYANAYGVDPELARRIALRESNYDPNAVSSAGARGIMQLMPGTAKDMGVDPNNPEQNIKGGIKYYAMMRDEFGPVMGLAAYNWGPENVRQYLKGNIKNMPSETQKYLATLGPYADKEYLNAPMDLQGRSGVFPTVLPTSSNTQEVIPPQRPGDMKMNDEYESMKIFNPYIQMALGILSGNSGVNKTEAFANAMQGGLRANIAGQEALDRARKTALEQQQVKMKQDEYDRMKRSVEQTKKFATSMASKGGPMADFWKGVSETDDPDTIIKGQELASKLSYYDMMQKYYTDKTDTTKPNSYSLPTEADVKNANSMLENDPGFGENYTGLAPDQKKALAAKYATAAKRLADLGDPNPWESAKSVVGQLPESKQWGLDKIWGGVKEIGGEVIKPFKDILGW